MNEKKTLGQIAYEARGHVGWTVEHSLQRGSWERVADAVAAEVRKECADEIEKLRRHRSAAMLANAELAKERAECERLRKERDAAHAALSERAKKDAELFAPTTDVKEPGQRAFEAYMSFAVYGAKWASTTDGGTWAHVERTIEAPLLDEIAAVKERCAQIENDLHDKIILYSEALRERDKARAECERIRSFISIYQMAPLHDKAISPPEHEFQAAVAKQKEPSDHQSESCLPTNLVPVPPEDWVMTTRFRWLRGHWEHGRYKLQQLWSWKLNGREEWRDVEVVFE